MTAYDDTHIPYLVTFAVDTLFLIPFLVVAIILGQPLSITTCSDLSNETGRVMLPVSAPSGERVSYVVFSGAGRTTCYELMAVWGLLIALCVLFATSAIAAGFLYLGKRRATSAASFGRYPAMNESQIEMAPPKGSFSRSPSSAGSFDGPPYQRAEDGYGGPRAPGSPTGSFGGGGGGQYGRDSPAFDNSRPGSPAGSFGAPGGLTSPPPAHRRNFE